MARIVIASNTAWSLHNFRAGVIRALLQRGDEVFAVAPADAASEQLTAMGCRFIDLPMDNKGTNPVRDLATVLRFWRLYRELRPDVAMHFTIKPVIYGSLGARLVGVPCINTVTGLGTAFVSESWLTRVVEWLYRVSQRWPKRVFFQNPDDRQLFIDRQLVSVAKTGLLPGSGVDLGRFSFHALLEGPAPVFLFIGRMLWDKGVGELVEAARIVRARVPAVRFVLVGPQGVANRSAIPASTIAAWVAEGVVEYPGTTEDVRPWIEQAGCVVLPSYREGVPRSLMEAAAMGRPVITTDAVGCREVVEDGRSGYLCRPRDSSDLADKLLQFLALDVGQRRLMGRAGREKMERDFDERAVVERYISAVDEVRG